MTVTFTKGQRILFQGDSITDASRSRSDTSDMGRGYASMAAALLGARQPRLELQFLNRGISGNRVVDLARRWDGDCIDLKPQWVSLLIGINDCWRRYDQGDPTPAEQFESGYRDLLRRLRKTAAPRLILCEPFLVPVREEQWSWREDLDPKIQAVRRLAREFDALYVPFDGIFAAASRRCAPQTWTLDGVHPTPAGHALMAEAWLGEIEKGLL